MIPKRDAEYWRDRCYEQYAQYDKRIEELERELKFAGFLAQERLEDAQKARREVAELREALEALVKGLDTTYWSSWQSTARFQAQLEIAREALSKCHAQDCSQG